MHSILQLIRVFHHIHITNLKHTIINKNSKKTKKKISNPLTGRTCHASILFSRIFQFLNLNKFFFFFMNSDFLSSIYIFMLIISNSMLNTILIAFVFLFVFITVVALPTDCTLLAGGVGFAFRLRRADCEGN